MQEKQYFKTPAYRVEMQWMDQEDHFSHLLEKQFGSLQHECLSGALKMSPGE